MLVRACKCMSAGPAGLHYIAQQLHGTLFWCSVSLAVADYLRRFTDGAAGGEQARGRPCGGLDGAN